MFTSKLMMDVYLVDVMHEYEEDSMFTSKLMMDVYLADVMHEYEGDSMFTQNQWRMFV